MTVITSGIRTCPISRMELAILTDIVMGMPIQNMMRMYCTAWSRIRSACEFPISIRESTCLGKTTQTRTYGMNAASPAASLKRKACCIPSLFSAPKNWVMKMPPDMQMALRNTMKINNT